MPLVTVRENKLGLILGWIDTGLFCIVFCGCIITLLTDIVNNATDDVWSKLALLIIVMPFLISFTAMKISSIVSYHRRALLLYDDHKKLAIIEDTMENYREALSILRERNFTIVEEKKFFRIFRWMRMAIYIVISQAIQYFIYFYFCFWYFYYSSFPVV